LRGFHPPPVELARILTWMYPSALVCPGAPRSRPRLLPPETEGLPETRGRRRDRGWTESQPSQAKLLESRRSHAGTRASLAPRTGGRRHEEPTARELRKAQPADMAARIRRPGYQNIIWCARPGRRGGPGRMRNSRGRRVRFPISHRVGCYRRLDRHSPQSVVVTSQSG
jgi:hypothetical protein